jgi:hypothetical protein
VCVCRRRWGARLREVARCGDSGMLCGLYSRTSATTNYLSNQPRSQMTWVTMLAENAGESFGRIMLLPPAPAHGFCAAKKAAGTFSNRVAVPSTPGSFLSYQGSSHRGRRGSSTARLDHSTQSTGLPSTGL